MSKYICIEIQMLYLHVCVSVHVYAYGPKTGRACLRFILGCAILGVGVGWGNNLFGLRFVRLSFMRSSVLGFPHFMLRWFCSSVHTFHVRLITSFVIRLTHFMWCWTRLLLFGSHTSCFAGHVFCTCVDTLHVRLVASSALGLTHFKLRWTRRLFFGSRTSCYVGSVFCTLYLMIHDICQGLSRLGTGGTFIGMQIFATSLPKRSASWNEGKRSAGALAKRKTIQKTQRFLGCPTYMCLAPTAAKQRCLLDPSRIAMPNDNRLIVNMWQTPGFKQTEAKTDLKTHENAGPISGPYGCICMQICMWKSLWNISMTLSISFGEKMFHKVALREIRKPQVLTTEHWELL